MTPALATQFATVVAWVGIVGLGIGVFQFFCWLRYKDVPPPPTGCPLPDSSECGRNFAANIAWLTENDPKTAARFAAWDTDDARTGNPQYRLVRR